MNNCSGKMAGVLCAALVAVLMSGCGGDEPEIESPLVRPIKMMEIANRTAGRRLEYPGRVSPIVESELSFEVPGRINYFPVKEGQWLEEGEVIARVDDRNFRAEVTSFQARLKAAQADYDRFRELLANGAVSQRDLETRRRNFEVAQSNLAVAEKALEDTELRAHFAGRVARKLANDFQNVLARLLRIATPIT
jgi:RND family efflux transporter MFP subunit